MTLTQKTIGIKFNGDFKKLKGYGYTFYKEENCWNKQDWENHRPALSFWIWKPKRLIEIDAWGNCSEAILNKLKSVNWDEIDSHHNGEKYIIVYWEHCDPNCEVRFQKGFNIKTETQMEACYKRMRRQAITFQMFKTMVKELEFLQKL